jgi:hypothetical protein
MYLGCICLEMGLFNLVGAAEAPFSNSGGVPKHSSRASSFLRVGGV